MKEPAKCGLFHFLVGALTRGDSERWLRACAADA
jgi:hypothetical protein